MEKRVVITGMGLVSPLGSDVAEVFTHLLQQRSSIKASPKWHEPPYGLKTSLYSPVEDFSLSDFPRKQRRTMTRVSGMAVKAASSAIKDSLLTPELVSSERTGVSFGSTMGGVSSLATYFEDAQKSGSMVNAMNSTMFPQIMSHTCAANVAINLGIPGRLIASCVACAASTQAIGYAYEAIKSSQADRMVAGGAEELDPFMIAVFDRLGATAKIDQSNPEGACKPFSKDRNGVVAGEGAGCIILEERESAIARAAPIYGEIIGFATNNDAKHMTNPSKSGLVQVIKEALESAKIDAKDLSYVNAHATGTQIGDQTEAEAIYEVIGTKTPVSSLKGHFGHLMGACGVVETIASLEMMRSNRFIPTLNLDTNDHNCANLNFTGPSSETNNSFNYILKNSFAFGGVNASLVISRHGLVNE